MTNADLKQHAKYNLSGHWGLAIGSFFVSVAILAILGRFLNLFLPSGPTFFDETISYGDTLASLLLNAPLSVGVISIYLALMRRNRDPQFWDLFSGFSHYGTLFIAGLLTQLLVYIGTLLFIIPGIIVGLGLSQTLFLLSDDPEMGAIDAMQLSWNMMRGHKMELFLLQLSFLGWILLCILILPMLYVIPYYEATLCNYYDNLCAIYYGNRDQQYIEN
jgi:uncharacterized membrane protein